MLNRRQLLRSTLLLSGGLALAAACGPAPAATSTPATTSASTSVSAPAPATTPASAAQPAAAGSPTRGGTLRVGLSVDVVTLDPHLSGSKFDRQVYHNLYDPLFILDIKLRSGLKFHDGTALDAEAARFNFDRMANDPKSVRKGEVANIASTEVVDPQTLKINLKQPDSSLLATLTDRAGMMISPTALGKLGADLGNNATGAGTGPFQFVEWVPDDHVLLKRNDTYWSTSGGPYLDQVRYRPIPDDTVKLQSLQNNEIDVLDYLAPRNVSIAKSDSNLVVIDVPSLAAFWFTLNTTRPPFSDKNLRLALTYALDTDALVKGVYLGVGVPANGPISPASWAYDNSIKPVQRDLNKAKQYLAAAGQPNGFAFDFEVVNVPIGIQEGEVVKAQLAEAGITCNVVQIDGARQLSDGNNKMYDMTGYDWSGRPDPDGNTYQFFHTTPGVSLNWSGISNPQLDQLLEQTRQVTDHDQRKQLYSQAIGILKAEAPVVWEIHPVEPKALSPKLQGYTPIPDGMLRFRDVYLKS
jgi:peptide/nickel transport system substrate-binding protein